VHQQADRLGRTVHVIGETNQNDVRQITAVQQHGIGLDAVWNDDFHHSLHAVLTGERMSVYRDHGSLENLAKAYREGFVLSGQYSPHHQRHHGSCSRTVPGHRFVVFSQNHDQIGNRLYGERLSQLVGFEQLKLTAAAVLLAPCVPLLFMGEEYGEQAPFLYFVDHSDPELLQRVRAGRLTDYPAFVRPGEPVPDPTDPETFGRSQVRLERRHQGSHRALWQFHQHLLRLRATTESLAHPDQERHEVWVDETGKLIGSRRWFEQTQTLAMFHFGEQQGHLTPQLPKGSWTQLLDSADVRWDGPGSHLPQHFTTTDNLSLHFAPHSVVVYRNSDQPDPSGVAEQ
jgi:maltooligosyltrehalose trehalohydrolase